VGFGTFFGLLLRLFMKGIVLEPDLGFGYYLWFVLNTDRLLEMIGD
jgi:hypothetical protein